LLELEKKELEAGARSQSKKQEFGAKKSLDQRLEVGAGRWR